MKLELKNSETKEGLRLCDLKHGDIAVVLDSKAYGGDIIIITINGSILCAYSLSQNISLGDIKYQSVKDLPVRLLELGETLIVSR